MLATPAIIQPVVLVYGNTILDINRECITKDRTEFLAPKEFMIFRRMIELAGHPLNEHHLRADYPDVTKRLLAVHLSRIRKKLRNIDSNVKFRAVRDKGYCLMVS